MIQEEINSRLGKAATYWLHLVLLVRNVSHPELLFWCRSNTNSFYGRTTSKCAGFAIHGEATDARNNNVDLKEPPTKLVVL